MASEVKTDKLSQRGSSGIVITDDIKLSSGKAIKQADGTDLLTEAGALGSGVTGLAAFTWETASSLADSSIEIGELRIQYGTTPTNTTAWTATGEMAFPEDESQPFINVTFPKQPS